MGVNAVNDIFYPVAAKPATAIAKGSTKVKTMFDGEFIHQAAFSSPAAFLTELTLFRTSTSCDAKLGSSHPDSYVHLLKLLLNISADRKRQYTMFALQVQDM